MVNIQCQRKNIQIQWIELKKNAEMVSMKYFRAEELCLISIKVHIKIQGPMSNTPCSLFLSSVDLC